MKYITIIIFSLLTISLFQCKSKETEKIIKSLHDQLMLLHDETMAKQGESMSLIAQLKAIKESSAVDNATTIDSIRTELDYSNEMMMDWMADYQDPVTNDTSSISYLRSQIDQMNKISSHMQHNIELAKSILPKSN
ncbi:MAG: hypothetical protein IPF70_07730 [Saprospiraceae bacterium]|nr:hypothetical protein [Saprospiraceae bacterium]MBK7608693.1 hypothetical protein [Saprospiraceae bacterium]